MQWWLVCGVERNKSKTSPDPFVGHEWDVLRILILQMHPSIAPFDEFEARRCCRGPHDAFKWMLKMQTAPEDTAAIIIEPILGEGGFVAPPPDFLSTLRKHCDEHGIVMIIDEVSMV